MLAKLFLAIEQFLQWDIELMRKPVNLLYRGGSFEFRPSIQLLRYGVMQFAQFGKVQVRQFHIRTLSFMTSSVIIVRTELRSGCVDIVK